MGKQTQHTKSLLLFAGISSRFLICQSDEFFKCNSGSFPKSEFLSPILGHHTCTHGEEPNLSFQTLALQAFITAHSTQRTRYIIFATATQWDCLRLKYYTCCTPKPVKLCRKSYNLSSSLIPHAEPKCLAWLTNQPLTTSVYVVLHLLKVIYSKRAWKGAT